MIKWQKIAAAVILCAVVTCLSGCSTKTDISGFSENTLALNRDGSVTELAVEPFGESYYSIEDLKAFVADEVDKYNKNHPAQSGKEDEVPITVDEVAASGDEAKVILTYKSAQDYGDFNYTRLEVTQASQLPEDAASLSFTDTKGADVGKIADVENADAYDALVTCTGDFVAVPGKIVYVSNNVSISDKSSAKCDGTLSVIIYK